MCCCRGCDAKQKNCDLFHDVKPLLKFLESSFVSIEARTQEIIHFHVRESILNKPSVFSIRETKTYGIKPYSKADDARIEGPLTAKTQLFKRINVITG